MKDGRSRPKRGVGQSGGLGHSPDLGQEAHVLLSHPGLWWEDRWITHVRTTSRKRLGCELVPTLCGKASSLGETLGPCPA